MMIITVSCIAAMAWMSMALRPVGVSTKKSQFEALNVCNVWCVRAGASCWAAGCQQAARQVTAHSADSCSWCWCVLVDVLVLASHEAVASPDHLFCAMCTAATSAKALLVTEHAGLLHIMWRRDALQVTKTCDHASDAVHMIN
jgi:hypothetical protein